MKILSLVVLLMFSKNLWSCPMPNGNFVCTYRASNGTQETGIVESVISKINSGIVTYIFDGDDYLKPMTYIADGAEHSFDNGVFFGKLKTTCSAQTIKITLNGTERDTNEYVKGSESIIVDANDNYSNTINYSYEDGTTVSGVFRCVKKSMYNKIVRLSPYNIRKPIFFK